MKTGTIAAIVPTTKSLTAVFLLLFAATMMFLGGCAGPSFKKSPPVDAERLAQADQLRADGVYHVAAEIYLSLSGETTDPLKSDLVLSAIESLLAGGDTQRARELLGSLPATLTKSQQNRARLANAEAALFEYQPEQALEILSAPLDAPSSETVIRYHRLRAEAYRLAANRVAAIQERIHIDTLLSPGADRQQNQRALWQDLLQASDSELEELSRQTPSGDTEGWITLVQLVRSGQQDPAQLAETLSDWELRNPSHPAVAGGTLRELQAGIARLANYPQQVGVLLPFTGPWAHAAAAVRDGMLAAYYARPEYDGRPTLRFYDTGTDPAQTLAKYEEAVTDGAGFVIGPLRKKSVAALAQTPRLDVPVLALNSDEAATTSPINLYHFSLAPEDEAGQVAEQARGRGYRRAVAIVPSGPWGERVVAAFASRWEALGGELLEVTYFSDDQKQLSKSVSELLNISDSKRRYRNLSRVLGKKLEFEPRRRQDADFVLLVAMPQRARLIRPLLQFHRASDLPVLATSHVYNGTRSGNDRDMNGILFCDMPWVLSDGANVMNYRRSLDEAMPDRSRRYTRFYAMGIDAWNLIPYLPEMDRGTFQWYSGMTGNLQLDEDRNIRRALLWAEFRNGVPRLVNTAVTSPRPDTGPSFSSQDERNVDPRMEANDENSSSPHQYGTIR